METTKQIVRWYDGFSRIYDLMNDYPYTEPRKAAIEALQLQKGDVVLDFFCGTGVNFKSLLDHVGETGQIIGIDGSAGMLQQAQNRLQKLGLNASQFVLREQNLLNLEADFLRSLIPAGVIPKVLLTLGVAGHPDWIPFWDTLFGALPVGTRFTTMDVSCAKGSLSAKALTWLAAGQFGGEIADYRAWERLKERSANYEEREYPAFNLLRCSVIVASGEKPAQ